MSNGNLHSQFYLFVSHFHFRCKFIKNYNIHFIIFEQANYFLLVLLFEAQTDHMYYQIPPIFNFIMIEFYPNFWFLLIFIILGFCLQLNVVKIIFSTFQFDISMKKVQHIITNASSFKMMYFKLLSMIFRIFNNFTSYK